jgi:hypothetical protein
MTQPMHTLLSNPQSGDSRHRTIAPRIRPTSWDLDAVLPLDYAIAPEIMAQVPQEIYENFCRLLSRDVYSEGDAQVLYDHLIPRAAEFSPGFVTMLKGWLADELKHYEALRRTYRCVAGVSFAQMDQHCAQRCHEIAPIARVLTDEFTLLVTFMFDEIGSVYSYRRDLWEYYRHFGTAIQKIGHHLVQDEGLHFNNAAQLLLSQHAHRLGEVAALLEQISALETRLKCYYNTFFLDHAQEQYRFPPQFNAVLMRLILAHLGLGHRPSVSELQDLWQWAPQEYRIVPILPISV